MLTHDPPVIYYGSPYCLNGNIGEAYNRFLGLLPFDHDYACLVDGDTLFTTRDYGHQIAACVQENITCRLFYATTNRVGCHWQIAAGAPVGHDIWEHRQFGVDQAKKHGTQVVERQTELVPASGFLMVVRKDLWLEVPFKSTGFYGVDWLFFQRVARRESVLQMIGVYLYHWYRGK